MYFNVRRSVLGPWAVVHVTGEVDLATAPAYRSELGRAARESSRLMVDLTGCDLIDSIGLGITVGASRRVAESGGAFGVVATGRVRDLFRTCRLDEILTIVESLDVVASEVGQ